jgi:hypothetical protein
MTKRTYKCSECGGVYESEWTEEEANAELERDFPGTSIEECDVVCDNCYQIINPSKNPELYDHYMRYHDPHREEKLVCEKPDCSWRMP